MTVPVMNQQLPGGVKMSPKTVTASGFKTIIRKTEKGFKVYEPEFEKPSRYTGFKSGIKLGWSKNKEGKWRITEVTYPFTFTEPEVYSATLRRLQRCKYTRKWHRALPHTIFTEGRCKLIQTDANGKNNPRRGKKLVSFGELLQGEKGPNPFGIWMSGMAGEMGSTLLNEVLHSADHSGTVGFITNIATTIVNIAIGYAAGRVSVKAPGKIGNVINKLGNKFVGGGSKLGTISQSFFNNQTASLMHRIVGLFRGGGNTWKVREFGRKLGGYINAYGYGPKAVAYALTDAAKEAFRSVQTNIQKATGQRLLGEGFGASASGANYSNPTTSYAGVPAKEGGIPASIKRGEFF